MTQPDETTTRPASPPLAGATRTALGASVLATALIGGLSISNPVLAAAAIALGTGVLSGTGKMARDHLSRPPQPGFWGGVKSILANAFSWLG